MAFETFKVGLLTHFDLWKSLTMKPPRSMHQLMDWFGEHKRVKDNQNHSKGKANAFTLDHRDNSAGRFTLSRLRRDFFNQASRNPAVVNSVFKELIY